MTRWERKEDLFYRDKLLAGIQCIKQANYGLISGPTYGYDPNTGLLTSMGDDNWGAIWRYAWARRRCGSSCPAC